MSLTTSVLHGIVSVTMQLISTVTTKGQVVIPKAIRDQFGIQPFDRVLFSVQEKKILVGLADSVGAMYGFLKTAKKHSEREIKNAIAEGISGEFRRKLKSKQI